MIRWGGMEILENLEELVHPKHTALLLWNLSSAAISDCFNAESLTTNLGRLVASARARNVRVFYSRRGLLRWEDMGSPMLRMRMKQLRIADPDVYQRSREQHTAPSPLVRDLEPKEGDIVFEKFLPNAFLGTCFEWWLHKHQLKTIILAGASLETGIDGTAREALNRGYYAVIVRDCVGSHFGETYEAAMESVQRIFDVFDSTDIAHAWEKS